jgi:flavin reductase (DIM6/NTAB) family NADH-FMN oxidoreductase RutF
MECELRQVIPLGVDSLYLGEIAEIHCDEKVMVGNNPDPAKIRPFMFTFPDNGYYALGKKIGEAWKAGEGYTKKP